MSRQKCVQANAFGKELGMSGMMGMPVIPVLRRLAQEKWEFEAS